MKNLLIVFISLLLVIALSWLIIYRNEKTTSIPLVPTPATSTPSTTAKSINLTVYIQDKKAAELTDCGITLKKNITVPKTTAVAAASLEYLFASELKQYAQFKSVSIKEGVAEIILTNDNDPDGLKISALSSCESRHLTAVLSDTLTQYDSINEVVLFSENGPIEF